MEYCRIVISALSETTAEKLSEVLCGAGFTVADIVYSLKECLNKVRILRPDIVIIDLNGNSSEYETYHEELNTIIHEKNNGVIMLANSTNQSICKKYADYVNFHCLIRPINKQILIVCIEMMLKTIKNIQKLEQEVANLKTMLDTRKEVERAKGLLMKNLGLSEEEAFRRIQKQSMDRGISMKEIAKAIILAYDI